MDDVIFSEDSQIFKIQYLRNYAINIHRVNAKKFQKFFPKDLFYKINNDSDFIAPLNTDCWVKYLPNADYWKYVLNIEIG